MALAGRAALRRPSAPVSLPCELGGSACSSHCHLVPSALNNVTGVATNPLITNQNGDFNGGQAELITG